MKKISKILFVILVMVNSTVYADESRSEEFERMMKMNIESTLMIYCPKILVRCKAKNISVEKMVLDIYQSPSKEYLDGLSDEEYLEYKKKYALNLGFDILGAEEDM